MNSAEIRSTLDKAWDASIVPTLQDYIRIPNQSPLFDPDWQKAGHMARAVQLARKWVEDQKLTGLRERRPDHKDPDEHEPHSPVSPVSTVPEKSRKLSEVS